MKNPEKTICKFKWSYPVVDFGRGSTRACCKTASRWISPDNFSKLGTDAFLNSDFEKERRKDMLEGIRHSECQSCWDTEDRGVRSMRSGPHGFVEFMNRSGKKGNFEELLQLPKEELLRADKPQMLEVMLGNACNLKCVYCSPAFSSSWEQEALRFGDMTIEQTARRVEPAAEFLENFWKWVEQIQDTLERVIFIGGEPLLQPSFYQFLDHLLTHAKKRPAGSNKLILNIVTNLGINEHFLRQFLTRLPELTEYFDVCVDASIEATAKRAEYIRNGLKWETFIANTHKVLSLRLPIRFGFHSAINALCVGKLPEIIEVAADLQNQYGTSVYFKDSIVAFPQWLSPFVLPTEFASSVLYAADLVDRKMDEGIEKRHRYFSDFLRQIGTSMREGKPDPQLQSLFYQMIKQNDSRRGSNFVDVFPEYSDLWHDLERSNNLTGNTSLV